MTLIPITEMLPRSWYGKLPPTAGTYYPGDEVKNIMPIAGHPQGWRYTSLGTWVPYGETIWTPHQATNVGFWLEAWMIVGLVDSAAVTSWKDYRVGMIFAQTTSTKQPTYQTNELNGAPIIRFDGGDILDNTAQAPFIIGNTNGALFAVVKSNAAADDSLVGGSRASGSSAYFVRMSPRGTADNVRITQRANDTADAVRGSTTAIGTAWKFLFVGSTGTSYDFEVDGVSQAKTVDTGADNGDWFADSPTLGKVSVGGLGLPSGDANFFDGDVAMLLYFTDYATANGLKDEVKVYVNSLYGLAIP